MSVMLCFRKNNAGDEARRCGFLRYTWVCERDRGRKEGVGNSYYPVFPPEGYLFKKIFYSAEDRTYGLTHAGQVLYHWATPQPLQGYSLCASEGFNTQNPVLGSVEQGTHPDLFFSLLHLPTSQPTFSISFFFYDGERQKPDYDRLQKL